jgi:hypothetical protein
VTEAEAKTKWCPQARVAIGEDFETGSGIQFIAANRAEDFPNPHHARCLGSECMAWRRIPEQSGDLIQAIKDYRVKHDCDLLTAKNAVEAARRNEFQGYCGLAGAPQ